MSIRTPVRHPQPTPDFPETTPNKARLSKTAKTVGAAVLALVVGTTALLLGRSDKKNESAVPTRTGPTPTATSSIEPTVRPTADTGVPEGYTDGTIGYDHPKDGSNIFIPVDDDLSPVEHATSDDPQEALNALLTNIENVSNIEEASQAQSYINNLFYDPNSEGAQALVAHGLEYGGIYHKDLEADVIEEETNYGNGQGTIIAIVKEWASGVYLGAYRRQYTLLPGDYQGGSQALIVSDIMLEQVEPGYYET
ncbi:hypothetical protein HY346_03060 [Candidatus Microgenomates bacterium]|nr:hypothetical protein [Candidatus Microgenomates bacterium]